MVMALVAVLCISYVMAMYVVYILGVIVSIFGIKLGEDIKTCSYNMGKRIKLILRIKGRK